MTTHYEIIRKDDYCTGKQYLQLEIAWSRLKKAEYTTPRLEVDREQAETLANVLLHIGENISKNGSFLNSLIDPLVTELDNERYRLEKIRGENHEKR